MTLTDIKRADLDRELAYMGIDTGTADTLRTVKPTIMAVLPDILDRFYERTMATPEPAAKFPSAEKLRYAKEAQAKHWAVLFDGRFDDAYQQSAQRIGLAHHRIDLSPQWYVSGYAFVLGELLAALAVSQGGFLNTAGTRRTMADVLCAVSRAVLLDMELAMSAYWGTLSSERGQEVDSVIGRIDHQVIDTIDSVSNLTDDLVTSAHTMTGVTISVGRDTAAASNAANEALMSAQTVPRTGDVRQPGVGSRYRRLTEPLPLRGGDADPDRLAFVLEREALNMRPLFEHALGELRPRRAAGVGWARFSPVLLVGPPGVGKTRAVKRLGQLLGTGFADFSLAGAADSRFITGTARGWTSAQPGSPILALLRAGFANPVVLVEEVDKVGSGDVNGSALEALLSAGIRDSSGSLRPVPSRRGGPVRHLLGPEGQRPVPAAADAPVEDVRSPGRPTRSRGLRRRAAQSARGHRPRTRNRVTDLPEIGDAAVAELTEAFGAGRSIRDLKRAIRRALLATVGMPRQLIEGDLRGPQENPVLLLRGPTNAAWIEERGSQAIRNFEWSGNPRWPESIDADPPDLPRFEIRLWVDGGMGLASRQCVRVKRRVVAPGRSCPPRACRNRVQSA